MVGVGAHDNPPSHFLPMYFSGEKSLPLEEIPLSGEMSAKPTKGLPFLQGKSAEQKRSG